jgi:hypothetical protein
LSFVSVAILPKVNVNGMQKQTFSDCYQRR